MNFPKVRANKKDSDTVVVGWYFEDCPGRSDDLEPFILPDCIGFKLWGDAVAIDPATAAVATGKLDKHGKEIFGSMEDMRGGDEVRDCRVQHGTIRKVEYLGCGWKIQGHPLQRSWLALDTWESKMIEIIPKKK